RAQSRGRPGARSGADLDPPRTTGVVPPRGLRTPLGRGVLADEQGRRGPLRPVPGRRRGARRPARQRRRLTSVRPAAGAADAADGPSRDAPGAGTLLMGTISLDHYLATGEVLPGGGVLNMAWQWRQLGRPFAVLTRVGAEDGVPIARFLDRHAIPTVARDELASRGRSSTIDIEILPDRQPWMDNFVPGVWADYRLTALERAALANAARLHVVLVEGAIAELDRLAAEDALHGIEVSADFLGFRHYTVDRLAATMRHVDLGFVGWPGDEDDAVVIGMRAVAHDQIGRAHV